MTRMLRNPIALGIVTILLLILVANTFSIVRETDQAVIVRFGQPQRIYNK
jgi:modulator of FtsH protease HflC